jgi:hypothetical protein
MLKRVLAIGLFLCFSAVSIRSQSGRATVHFYGDGYFGVRHVPLYVDDKKVATLHGREVIDVPVLPGKHSIHSGDKHSGLFVEATENGDYYVKVSLGGSFVLHGQVTLVEAQQGEYEVQVIREKH